MIAWFVSTAWAQLAVFVVGIFALCAWFAWKEDRDARTPFGSPEDLRAQIRRENLTRIRRNYFR